MSFRELQDSVIAPELCTGCGVCALACPRQAISFGADDVVSPRAEISESDCGDCNVCVDACPGLDPATAEQEMRLLGRRRTVDERWTGIYQGVYGGASMDEEIFDASASGGSATTLLAAAMAYFGAEAALVMGRDGQRPWRSAPEIVRTRDGLLNCTQSTYQLAPYLSKLRDLFLHEPDTKVVMSGIACHVQAIRKLQCLDVPIGAWARAQIVFIIEIGCSSNTLPVGTESLVTDVAHVPLSEVSRLRYREGEYPGEIEVRTRDGNRKNIPFWQAVRHFKENKTHRCLSCGDWVSGLADITVSDGDPNIFKGSLGLNGIAKHGRVFVRTERGAQTLRYADLMNMLEIWPVELDGLNLGLERKRNRRASYERSGQPIPRGPIPGHTEDIRIKADEELIAVPDQGTAEPAHNGGAS